MIQRGDSTTQVTGQEGNRHAICPPVVGISVYKVLLKFYMYAALKRGC